MADKTTPLLRMFPLFRTLSELSEMQKASYVTQYVQEAKQDGSAIVIEKVEIAWKCVGCGEVQKKKYYGVMALLDAGGKTPCQKCGTEAVIEIVAGMRRTDKT